MLKGNYEVEVLVNGSPVKEYKHENKIYIEGKKNTKFSLRFKNNTGNSVLFVPSVDGLSILDGKDASLSSRGYIVRPYSSSIISGWRKNENEIAEFFFSDGDSSYRKKSKKGTNNLGVIGAAVFREKKGIFEQVAESAFPIAFPVYVPEFPKFPKFPARPWDVKPGPETSYSTTGPLDFKTETGSGTVEYKSAENDTASLKSVSINYSSSSGDLGTGWGETKKSLVETIPFEKESTPDAVFVLYYNSKENLEKAGVDMKSKTEYVTPSPFPGEYCKPPEE